MGEKHYRTNGGRPMTRAFSLLPAECVWVSPLSPTKSPARKAFIMRRRGCTALSSSAARFRPPFYHSRRRKWRLDGVSMQQLTFVSRLLSNTGSHYNADHSLVPTVYTSALIININAYITHALTHFMLPHQSSHHPHHMVQHA